MTNCGVNWRTLRMALLTMTMGVSPLTAHALSIQFDYRYDTNNFYTADKRAVLNQAASYFSGFSDSLAAIAPDAGENYALHMANPNAFQPAVVVDNFSVASDAITVFVGSFNVSVPILGFAYGGEIRHNGQSLDAATLDRGQGTTTGANAVDVAPWGGVVSINSAINWNTSLEAPAPDQNDLLTTVTHEIMHILGVGQSDAWYNLVQDMNGQGFFLGDKSMGVFGGPIPTDSRSNHWAEGVSSLYMGVMQETLMDPSTPRGVRQLPTELDMAALEDIGWQASVTPVPLPGAFGFYLFGIALLCRKRLSSMMGRGQRVSA